MIVVLIAVFIGYSKSFRLSKTDISFSPYKTGDTLFFLSSKNESDTLIIKTTDKEILREKSYSIFDAFTSYIFGESWEVYSVYAEHPNQFGKGLGPDILTIRVERDGTKNITFFLSPVNNATWYGNHKLENEASKLLTRVHPKLSFSKIV